MESEARKEYGGSLPVENVQKLASLQLKKIPNRYIRPELEYDDVSIDESLEIPIIDMAKLSTQGLDEMEKLHNACKNWGFFQLINHGASEAIIEKMKVDLEDFFKLPIEDKMVFAQLPNDAEGYGQAFVVSEDQKLDWADMLFIYTRPASLRKMRFWPTIPNSFRSTLDEYSTELHPIAITLLSLMAKNLGIDPHKLTSLFENGIQSIRMNYYPPCPNADKVFGITPHSDAVGLTLLIQVNDVSGLQIKKNNKWMPVKPVSGAIIVNIGDIIEIMSNGEYSSIEHRAIVNSEKERLSIATFHNPNIKTKIGPLSDLTNESGAKYSAVDYEDFLRILFASKLDGKSLLDSIRINIDPVSDARKT